MPQVSKRADNVISDPTGDQLPFVLDVTIRALHQQSLSTNNKVLNAAVRQKIREYATKDKNGRRIAEFFFVPFVMTSMGNLDKKAEAFLKKLQKRDPLKAAKLKDLISVQHAHWIAVRLRRCLGFHSRFDRSEH